MKLTPEQRKTYHKLFKWISRNELSFVEQEIVATVRDFIGKNNISLDLEEIARQHLNQLFETLGLDIEEEKVKENDKLFENTLQQIIDGVSSLQKLGFIEIVSCLNPKEYKVNVIAVWQKKND